MDRSIEQAFVELCKRAYELDLETDDMRDTEPILVRILELVKQHPQERPLFVRLFIAVFEGAIPSPIYLLPFCMRELQYPEIKERVLQERETEQPSEKLVRMTGFINHILRAYDADVWEDADVWHYYAHELEHQNDTSNAKDTDVH